MEQEVNVEPLIHIVLSVAGVALIFGGILWYAARSTE
jgi:hypothetical protein